ncbi:gastrokine-2-like [Discoglossus pictus]
MWTRSICNVSSTAAATTPASSTTIETTPGRTTASSSIAALLDADSTPKGFLKADLIDLPAAARVPASSPVSPWSTNDVLLRLRSALALASGRPCILLVALCGVFINPLLADEAYQFINNGNNGETVYNTVSIHKDVNIAVFNVYAGRQTSNAVFDYSQNIIAYHMPYRGICIVAHMDIATFPSLPRFEEFIHTKREKRKELEELRKHYEVTNQVVNDLSQFGGAVEGLCWGVPTYWAQEYASPRPSGIGARGCAGAKLLFLQVNLCGGFHLF